MLFYYFWFIFVWGWAVPGGTAIPGQPVVRSEQAPAPHRFSKISLISMSPNGGRIRY